MLIETNPASASVSDQAAVNEIVSRGPVGAFALAGTAAAIVVAIWLAFYFLVYLPRA